MNSDFLVRLALALRNVFRHRIRTAATLAAISIGVASLILAGGFVQDIFFQLGEAIIHSQTGHLQVFKEGYLGGKNRAPDRYYIADSGEITKEIAGLPGVASVMARVGFTGVLNNGKRDVGIIGEGIEPAAEAALGTYLRYLDGRALRESDVDGIVVGQGVAKSLGLNVGDRVTLVISLAQGAVNTLEFELVGIFQSFSKDFDARAVRISLGSARALMDTQAAHVIVVTLSTTDTTDVAANAIRKLLAGKGFEVVAWQKLSDFYEKTLDLYDRQFGVLRFIILLMVLLSVANSVNMTLFERTREFGTMLALGNRPVTVFGLIIIESVFVGLIGAAAGVILGIGLAFGISAVGIPMPPPPNANLGYTAVIRLVPAQILGAAVIGFFATCLATLLPARRASRLNVVEALRQGV